MKKILLLEDDPAITQTLITVLRAENFQIAHHSSVTAALASQWQTCDFMVLDWNLPDGNGPDFLKEVRKRGINTPALFLTARTDLVSKVLGLESGADDYLSKPFEPQELIARIRAILRRGQGTTSTQLRFGEISINLDSCKVCKKDTELSLTRKEYELLKYFVENKGKVFSRDELLNTIWGFDSNPATRTVDMHVASLRGKLGEELIETVRGFGYRFKASE